MSLAATQAEEDRRHLCEFGNAPFSYAFARAQVEPYLHVYARRPYKTNPGGTGLVTGFMFWCLIKALQPRHIVESGAHVGLGTWLLRQAAPDAQLIIVSPAKPTKYYDEAADSLYFVGKSFQDFARLDWDCLKHLDKERTLLFFDDHQSQYRRVLEARARGFVHLLFDDNYPYGGDNFSVKMACDGDGALHRWLFHRPRAQTTHFQYGMGSQSGKSDDFIFTPAEHANFTSALRAAAASYYELPQIWPSAGSRFPSITATQFAQIRQTPVLTHAEGLQIYARLNVHRIANASFDAVARAVTHQAYVRLHAHARAWIVCPSLVPCLHICMQMPNQHAHVICRCASIIAVLHQSSRHVLGPSRHLHGTPILFTFLSEPPAPRTTTPLWVKRSSS